MAKEKAIILALVKAARDAADHLEAVERGETTRPFKGASIPEKLRNAIKLAEKNDPNLSLAKVEPPAHPKLQNLGSLITYQADGNVNPVCLGFLMYFEGRGTYDAYFGKVEVTQSQADVHNRLLSDGQLLGLDNNCEVGMHGEFYLNREKKEVRTFIGDFVAPAEISGLTIVFRRKNKVFRGKISPSDDCFKFRRIS